MRRLCFILSFCLLLPLAPPAQAGNTSKNNPPAPVGVGRQTLKTAQPGNNSENPAGNNSKKQDAAPAFAGNNSEKQATTTLADDSCPKAEPAPDGSYVIRATAAHPLISALCLKQIDWAHTNVYFYPVPGLPPPVSSSGPRDPSAIARRAKAEGAILKNTVPQSGTGGRP